MSYSSESRLAPGTQIRKVDQAVRLLGYEYTGTMRSLESDDIRSFFWYDETDYRSWSGVELSIHKEDGIVCVSTRSIAARSYYDL
jgi:hypothetical protein